MDDTVYRRSWYRCTLWLLAVWVLVSFVVPWFARDLGFQLFGWSFSYWMCVHGALLVYCAIAVYYAWFMSRLDARHGLNEDLSADVRT